MSITDIAMPEDLHDLQTEEYPFLQTFSRKIEFMVKGLYCIENL